MGYDMDYQAVPEDSELFQRALNEPAFANSLNSFHSYIQHDPTPRLLKLGDKRRLDFYKVVQQTTQFHPGIGERYLYIGRTWDKLYYLLSEDRRKDVYQLQPDRKGLVTRLIFGGDAIPYTNTGAGIPLRFLSPQEVKQAVEFLDAITPQRLREHYNPKAMEQAHVYKAFGSEEFDELMETFDELRDFYRVVASHGEGILTRLF